MAETNFVVSGMLKVLFEAETKSDKFKTRNFVIETEGQYPQLVQFQAVNDRCDILDNFMEGQLIEVSFDLRGREWNGKYITNLNAWKIQSALNPVQQTKLPAPGATRATQPKPQPANDPFPTYKGAGGEDDLPF
jgi:hypothetical protein